MSRFVRRPLLLATGVPGAVAGVVLAGALLLACAPAASNPVVEPATDSPAAMESPDAAGLQSWERLDLPPAHPTDGAPTDVVRFGASYVVVAPVVANCCAPSDVYAAVWLSADGEEWELVVPENLAGSSLRELATDGETLLAIGAVWPESPSGPMIEGERALFRSADGRSWEWLADAPQVSRLAVSGGRFVGIQGGDWAPVAWISDDGGASWDDHPMAIGGEDGQNRFAVNDLAAGADGTLVAVGSILPTAGEARPPSGTSWASSDGGESWTWAGEAVPEAELTRVAPLGERFHALGTPLAESSTLVYRSDDGVTWEGREVVRHAALDVNLSSWLGGTDAGLFLITNELAESGGLDSTLRASADGQAWSIVPDQPAFDGTNLHFAAIVDMPAGVLAVGAYDGAESGQARRPAAWQSSR